MAGFYLMLYSAFVAVLCNIVMYIMANIISIAIAAFFAVFIISFSLCFSMPIIIRYILIPASTANTANGGISIFPMLSIYNFFPEVRCENF